MIWKIRAREFTFDHTVLMAVLNLTPDSFSDGGKYLDPAKAVENALAMEAEGAEILDLGAESTRPGAREISAAEEMQRLLPVLRSLRARTRAAISVDTTKPEVAAAAIAEGAEIINDVSGLRPFRALGPGGLKDSGAAMAELIRKSGAGIILMHRRGNPQTMQAQTQYTETAEEVAAELGESVDLALAAGIRAEQIAVDPGLGFAKTAEQSFELLAQLEKFQRWGRPVVLGPSRKSFIGEATGRAVDEREFGTAAAAALAVSKGVQIIRIHQVAAMRDAVRVAEAVKQGEKRHVRSF